MTSRLIGADLVENPYPFYGQLRRDNPVWQLPETNAFFVATWDLVAEAVGRVDDFSNHFRHILFTGEDGALGVLDQGSGGGPDVFAGADPPVHTQHRRLFSAELGQKRTERLQDDVSALADELVDALLAGDGADVVSGLANPLPMRVIVEYIIGFRDPDIDQIQRWVFAGSRLMGGRIRLGEMAAVGAEAGGMAAWVSEQLDEALASPRRADVLGATAAGVREGIISRDEAAFTLMVFIGAGGETTTSVIGNAVRVLAARPDLQEELRAKPGLVAAFVEEVLRLESPFRFHPRTALRPVELNGVKIPERAMVMLLWGAANRDETVFARPDEVVLDRPSTRPHMGFGRGIHHCVGAPLARLESRIVLSRLLLRTQHFELDPEDPPRWEDNLWFRRHERLPIVINSA